MQELTRHLLDHIANEHGTPCYVYFLDQIKAQFKKVSDTFNEPTLNKPAFDISYAIKANPNGKLLTLLQDTITSLDASSLGEIQWAKQLGYDPTAMSYSGPVKSESDLAQAIAWGVGEVVCESAWEIQMLDRLAGQAGIVQPLVIRINPIKAPRSYGINMAGQSSQFGIDEELMGDLLEQRNCWTNLDCQGFHIYAGTNCLNEQAIALNMASYVDLFAKLASEHRMSPKHLIFGLGLGVPYEAGASPLDMQKLKPLVQAQARRIQNEPALAGARCTLEMGRYLVGPAGYFLTRIVDLKHSRGVELGLCDAGFNHHISACGLLGSMFRRPWPITKITPGASMHQAQTKTYTLVGPLCTTLDTLAKKVTLPTLHRNDVIAIASSGAYGLTASPTQFISHRACGEYIVVGTGENAQIINAMP